MVFQMMIPHYRSFLKCGYPGSPCKDQTLPAPKGRIGNPESIYPCLVDWTFRGYAGYATFGFVALHRGQPSKNTNSWPSFNGHLMNSDHMTIGQLPRFRLFEGAATICLPKKMCQMLSIYLGKLQKNIGSMGMVYLPTFTTKKQPYVGDFWGLLNHHLG